MPGRKISPPPLKVRAGTDAGKRLLGAGGGAAGVNYQADPAVPGLSKIAWQEIDLVLNGCTFLLFWFIPR